MKERYTIGETASLLGVTTQTLRHYDKIGLLSPKYTDENTGYRFYCYNQFHYIDKIKYLQSFGLSLDEISKIIKQGTVDTLLVYLENKKKEMQNQLLELTKSIDDINWYIEYFNYIGTGNISSNIYKIHLQERYVIKAPCYYREDLASMEIRLADTKSKEEYQHLKFRRQYGYTVDFEALLNGSFYPRNYFTFLSEKPNLSEDLYTILPAGEYLCFRTQILHEDFDPAILSEYFSQSDKKRLALALEFEDNLDNWTDAWYEVQILL